MKVQVGRVTKSHGIRGEVVVDVMTDVPEVRFADGAALNGTQAGKERTLTVASSRPHKGRLLVKFREVADRTEADTLRGMKFFAEPLERDDDSDEYFDHELIGLKVIHDGAEVGEVTGVMDTPNRKILEIDYSGREVLVPFVMNFVPDIDLDAQTLTITPPEGLLDV
ncbi:ribosome maturation factor RimM [Corynebacterium sp.]|uniref:ribosome maturation factor RimM n=1 Tax=Corynebacterium sp. TaxID=1720 RepID=UPI002A91E346|nr:ribosome maturation factor RimM [Corynebacterium sp.]MDY5786534.1 ribosome maturation factor RimM [Corynebacterium sp.]